MDSNSIKNTLDQFIGLITAVLSTCLLIILSTSCKYKPDFDIATGTLIYRDSCQNQPLYLFHLENIRTYSGRSEYSDTLLIKGISYNHVVQLDAKSIPSQLEQLRQAKINSRFTLDFNLIEEDNLPNCLASSGKRIAVISPIRISPTN